MTGPGPILITGASGFVGRHLGDALQTAMPDREVVAYGGPAKDAYRRLDVTDRDACFDAVRSARPAMIIHLAGQADVAAATADPEQAMRVNAGGTACLAEAALAHAPGVLFLAVSSSEVYGDSLAGGQPTPETAPLRPASAYARSKAAAEDAVQQAAGRGLHTIIARPFNHTGAGQSTAFVAPAFAAQIAAIEAGTQPAVMRVGALDDVRDFSDVRDIARGYAMMLSAGPALAPGTAINLASGKGRTIAALLEALRAMSRAAFTVELDPARQRASRLPAMVGDAARAASLLGWANSISFEATLADVLSDARQRLG